MAVGKPGEQDWIEIGDEKKHYPGKSQVKENGGKPAWGDDSTKKVDYKYVVVMKVKN